MTVPVAISGERVQAGAPTPIFRPRFFGAGGDINLGQQWDRAPDSRFLSTRCAVSPSSRHRAKRPATGILDRCSASRSCPKVVEVFGAAETWYLKMPATLVGTAADVDIPLPGNVRRYYIAGSPHGGGAGGFSTTPLALAIGAGTNWGQCILAANPIPHTETTRALLAAMREWAMHDTPMPPQSLSRCASIRLPPPRSPPWAFRRFRACHRQRRQD